jgi:hypothetical protein
MKTYFCILTFLVLCSIDSIAQQITISGRVEDHEGLPISDATVQLIAKSDSIATSTNQYGEFRLTFHPTNFSKFTIRFTHVGFEILTMSFHVDSVHNMNLGKFRMKERIIFLNKVVVSVGPLIRVATDTLEFDPSGIQLRQGSRIEELIRQLPGLSVGRDGEVTVLGEKVAKVMVNGMEFFTGKVQTATRNLLAQDVRNIQILNDYGIESDFTGVKTQRPQKVININLKKSHNQSRFATVVLGGGTCGQYKATLDANRFRGRNQLAIKSDIDNTSKNEMASIKSIETSYRQGVQEKLDVNVAIEGNWRRALERETLREEKVIGGNVLKKSVTSLASSSVATYSSSVGVKYKPNARNLLKLDASLNSIKSNSEIQTMFDMGFDLDDASREAGQTEAQNGGRHSNYGANLLLVHKFKQDRRNLTVKAKVDSEVSNDATLIDLIQSTMAFQGVLSNDLDQMRLQNQEFEISYSQPLNGQSLFVYYFKVKGSNTENSQLISWLGGAARTPESIDFLGYESKHWQLQKSVGVEYYVDKRNIRLKLGIFGQRSNNKWDLASNGSILKKSDFDLIPEIIVTYDFSASTMLELTYQHHIVQPAAFRLMPASSDADLFLLQRGNAILDAERNRIVTLNLSSFNPRKRYTIAFNFSAVSTQDKVIPVINFIPESTFTQESWFTNADHFYRIAGFYSFTKSILRNRANFSSRGSFSEDHSFIMMDGVKYADEMAFFSNTISVGFVAGTFEFDLDAEYSQTHNNSLDKIGDLETRTIKLGADSKAYIKNSLVVGAYFGKLVISTNGLTDQPIKRPTLLNFFFEWQLSKNQHAIVRAEILNALDQKQLITASSSYNSRVLADRTCLPRRFMLSFVARLSN